MIESLVYVALGDSSGRGVGSTRGQGYVDLVFERLARARPEAHLVNATVSGATTTDVLHFQLQRARAVEPRIATLFVGANDLWRGVRPTVFGDNMGAILEGLRVLGATVLVGTVPDLSHAPAAGFAEEVLGLEREQIAERVRIFNEHVERAAKETGAHLVDLFGVGLADRAAWFSADGFHPSDAGYTAWAELLWSSLEPIAGAVPSARYAS